MRNESSRAAISLFAVLLISASITRAETPPPVGVLINQLCSSDPDEAFEAAKSISELAKIAPEEAAAAIPWLVDAVCEDRKFTRENGFQGKWHSISGWAGDALTSLGDNSVPELLCALTRETDEKTLDRILFQLLCLNDDATSAIPAVERFYQTQRSPKLRHTAFQLLTHLCSFQKRSAVRLVSGLADRDPQTRVAAARALLHFQVVLPEAVPHLANMLDDAAVADVYFDPNNGGFCAASLQSYERPIACDAALALGEMGETALPARGRLIELAMFHENGMVRQAMAAAAIQIDLSREHKVDETLLRVIGDALENADDGPGQHEAMNSLERLDVDCSPVWIAIARATTSKQWDVDERAMDLLTTMKDDRLVWALCETLRRNENEFVCNMAARHLATMGERAKPAVPYLMEYAIAGKFILVDDAREAALGTLKQIDAQAFRETKVLIENLPSIETPETKHSNTDDPFAPAGEEDGDPFRPLFDDVDPFAPTIDNGIDQFAPNN